MEVTSDRTEEKGVLENGASLECTSNCLGDLEALGVLKKPKKDIWQFVGSYGDLFVMKEQGHHPSNFYHSFLGRK